MARRYVDHILLLARRYVTTTARRYILLASIVGLMGPYRGHRQLDTGKRYVFFEAWRGGTRRVQGFTQIKTTRSD